MVITITPILSAVVLEARKKAKNLEGELGASNVGINFSLPYQQVFLIDHNGYSLAGNGWRRVDEQKRERERAIIDEMAMLCLDEEEVIIPFELEPCIAGQIRTYGRPELVVGPCGYVYFKCFLKHSNGSYWSEGITYDLFEEQVKQIERMPQLYAGLDFLSNLSVLR
jgi:hypothetical protein